jgi:TetR/AcrR family transcriptional regulator, transcriptional repressor for nem operon
MSRPRSHSTQQVVASALSQFWRHGYGATSMDDLARVTGVGRHGIYSDFRGKRGLFLACLKAYQVDIVTPAFAAVERESAGLDEISAYFEYQIARAEAAGLPGHGCLVANTLTEIGPHDATVMKALKAHNARLQAGFLHALRNADQRPGGRVQYEIETMAYTLTVFAQGLWSMSRAVSSAALLRGSVKFLLSQIREDLS